MGGQKDKNLIKIIFVLAATILFSLVIFLVVQTGILHNLKNEKASLDQKNIEQARLDLEAEKELAYRESEKYLEDLARQENGYGKDDDYLIN
ncbi:MAG: hypothetical protein RR400_00060 [Clostridia bacterium]